MVSDSVRRDFGRSSNETLLYIYSRTNDIEMKNFIADVLSKRALKGDDIPKHVTERNTTKQKTIKKQEKRTQQSIDFFDPWDPER